MRFIHKRRNALATATIGGLALLITACSPSPSGSSAPSQGGKSTTIKIGVLRVATGPLAANGKNMENGWNLYWEQNGTTVGGAEVQSIFRGHGGGPRDRAQQGQPVSHQQQSRYARRTAVCRRRGWRLLPR